MSIRIYQSSLLSSNSEITLDEQASHHLMRVLRVKIGDEISVFNGQGGEFTARILRINKKSIEILVGQFNDVERESPVDIYLAQGIARGEKMDFIVQKAVELGVKKIFPLFTERSNVRMTDERKDKRLSHWQSVMISASEQSGRNRLPEIAVPQAFKTWVGSQKATYKFLLSPEKQKSQPLKMNEKSSILLLIGPEGGFTHEEEQLAIAHQFMPLNLGPRILRTETAGLAAIAILQAKFGDMDGNI